MTASEKHAQGICFPLELKVFAGLALLFAALSLGCAAIMSGRHGIATGFGPLWLGSPGFDFYDYLQRIKVVHTAAFFSLPGYPWYYAAPGAPLYAFFYLFCFHGSVRIGLAAFALVVIFLCLFVSGLLVRAMVARGIQRAHAVIFVSITLLTSWPIFFSLQRGNLESILWFGLALALWAVAKDRWAIAAVVLGLIAAVKIYPAIFFALFLRRRKWKELCLGALVMASITIASLRYINPNIMFALRGTLEGMRRWTEDYATRGLNPQFDHSFFELIKVAAFRSNLSEGEILKIYMPVAAAAMLGVFFWKMIKMPLSNQVLFLSAAAVCLPPASFDYTLQNMYVPFGWLVLMALDSRGIRSRWLCVVFCLYSVVLAPMTFLVIHGFGFSGLANGVALAGLMAISVAIPFQAGRGLHDIEEVTLSAPAHTESHRDRRRY